jgi:hypothetical protein
MDTWDVCVTGADVCAVAGRRRSSMMRGGTCGKLSRRFFELEGKVALWRECGSDGRRPAKQCALMLMRF